MLRLQIGSGMSGILRLLPDERTAAPAVGGTDFEVRSAGAMGLGLYALRPLAAGTAVTRVAGEHRHCDEARGRRAGAERLACGPPPQRPGSRKTHGRR